MPTFRIKHVVHGYSVDVYEVEARTEADAVAAVTDEEVRDQLTPVDEGEFVGTDGWVEADDDNPASIEDERGAYYVSVDQADDNDLPGAGWYWQTPNMTPGYETHGPFDSYREAVEDATRTLGWREAHQHGFHDGIADVECNYCRQLFDSSRDEAIAEAEAMGWDLL